MTFDIAPYASVLARKVMSDTPWEVSFHYRPVAASEKNDEGFQRWDPAPKSAEAKAFLVITAEDLGDGAFTTQIVGLSLNGLKDMGKNGIQHVAEPAEKQRAIVNGCLENASRAIVNRLAGKYDPFMRTKGPVQ